MNWIYGHKQGTNINHHCRISLGPVGHSGLFSPPLSLVSIPHILLSQWLLGYVICASSRVSSCLPTFSNCIRHLNCAGCDQTSQFDGRARCSLPLTQEAVHFSIPPRVYAPLLFLVGKPPSNMHSPRLSQRYHAVAISAFKCYMQRDSRTTFDHLSFCF